MQPLNKTEAIDFLEDVKNYFINQQVLYGDDVYSYYDFNSLMTLPVKPETSAKQGENKRSLLIKLFYQYKNCQICQIAKQRKKIVFGSGNSNSKIMLIGEAPGVNEDLQGKPFVGEAGKLLDKILAAINLDREKVFVTNVIKCHPPNNRDPNEEEIAACEIILKKQIEIIKPEYILILGRVAAQTLLKTNQPLRELRGKELILFGAKAVVTYHPAALLRDPGLKRKTWEDVQLFQKFYKQGN